MNLREHALQEYRVVQQLAADRELRAQVEKEEQAKAALWSLLRAVFPLHSCLTSDSILMKSVCFSISDSQTHLLPCVEIDGILFCSWEGLRLLTYRAADNRWYVGDKIQDYAELGAALEAEARQ